MHSHRLDNIIFSSETKPINIIEYYIIIFSLTELSHFTSAGAAQRGPRPAPRRSPAAPARPARSGSTPRTPCRCKSCTSSCGRRTRPVPGGARALGAAEIWWHTVPAQDRLVLYNENTLSIGFRSGEYAAFQISTAPAASIATRTRGSLWTVALSITTTERGSPLA